MYFHSALIARSYPNQMMRELRGFATTIYTSLPSFLSNESLDSGCHNTFGFVTCWLRDPRLDCFPFCQVGQSSIPPVISSFFFLHILFYVLKQPFRVLKEVWGSSKCLRFSCIFRALFFYLLLDRERNNFMDKLVTFGVGQEPLNSSNVFGAQFFSPFK